MADPQTENPGSRDIREIIECEEGQPIAAMERLIRAGGAAVPGIQAAIERHQGDDDRDLMPLIVVLGEIRSPDSISFLAGLLRQPALGEVLMDAASEALGKIGPAAVPALAELLDSPEVKTRFWALGSLSRMRHTCALPHLRKALKTMPEICGLAAHGLTDLNDKESIRDIYEVYEKLPNTGFWLPDLRDSIASLAGQLQLPEDKPGEKDWRTRWRRRPAYGWVPSPSTLMVGYIMWENYSTKKWRERKLEKETFEQITTKPEKFSEKEERKPCDSCGEKIIDVAAVPVCPELAYGSTLYQENLLQKCLKDGITTIPMALDDLDQELLYGDTEWADLSEEKRERWVLAQQTYEFLLLDGCRTVQDGILRIRELRAGLGRLWGIPQEELVDEELLDKEAFVRAGMGLPKNGDGYRREDKVGRNEPCPCGSGKKFKKCCGA